MINLTYTSSNGTVFDLLSWEGLKTETANYHKYQWGASVQTQRFGEKIVNFTKKAQMYEATFLFRGNLEERRQKIEEFHFCTEYDIAKQTPGRITWGSNYIECYITQSSTQPRDNGGTYTENNVSIYCPYPFWIEEQTIRIFPQDKPIPQLETDKGYPEPSTKFSYPYAYSYVAGRTAMAINTRHYDSSNFRLVCYGATDSVEINIGGRVGTLQFKIITICCGQLGLGEALGIVAGAAEIIVAAVLTVNSVPAVRKIYFFPICGHSCGKLSSLLGKCPFGIKGHDSSQLEGLLKHRKYRLIKAADGLNRLPPQCYEL